MDITLLKHTGLVDLVVDLDFFLVNDIPYQKGLTSFQNISYMKLLLLKLIKM